MLADLFSQFDPSVRVLFKYSFLLFWGRNFIIIFIMSFPTPFTSFRGVFSAFRIRFNGAYKVFFEMGLTPLQRMSNLLLSVFYLILVINLLGLLPGTFRVSSHFLFSMSLGIPLWFTILIMRFSKFPITKFGSYVGSGIPVMLGPPIGVCEIISTVMRPLALGLRLAANILAGHVITSLVANCLVFVTLLGGVSSLVFGAVSFGLFLFEGAVCVIQAYVFILLLRVYIQEYPV